MMKRMLIALVLAGVAWQLYRLQQTHAALESAQRLAEQRRAARSAPSAPPEQEWRPASFRGAETSSSRCDGRTHCSHMTSCAEATYFIQHCPGTQMDGDNDGIPCEQQWCR